MDRKNCVRSIEAEEVARRREERRLRDDKASTGESIITISVDDLSLACAPSRVQLGS